MKLNIVILTISDTRTQETDKSGVYLCNAVQEADHVIQGYEIIPDDFAIIVNTMEKYCQDPQVDVILSTGGTGITARDVTPEALKEVADIMIDGFGELFRWISFQSIGTSTVQSRACAGVHNGTLLFALPGSTGACKDAWTGILHQQLNIHHRPCNFAQLLPRLANAKRV